MRQHSALRFARDMLGLAWRVVLNCANDRVTYLAGGVTYFILLDAFPALAAFVALYGLFGDPNRSYQLLDPLRGVVPPKVLDYIGEELARLAAQGGAALSLQFAISISLSVWAANVAVKALIWGLNAAYREVDRRNWFTFTWLTLRMTLAGIAFVLAVGFLMAEAPRLDEALGGRGALSAWRWPFLFLAYLAMLSALYRWGPSRSRPNAPRRILPGAVVATVLSLAVSILFSWYVGSVAHLSKTYGPVGATIGFMLWTWLTVIAILTGAELNGELERRSSPALTVRGPS
jgi:membrane protein